METAEYQLRYVAYANAHGNTPQEQDKIDSNMMPFMIWIQNKWSEWRELNGYKRDDFLSESDHESFNTFIGIYSNGR